jgi:hypothetical protein
MQRYAQTTEVPVDRSRAHIEGLLRQHGAEAFAYGWDPTHDRIQFTLRNRTIRFLLPRPDPKDKKYRLDRRGWIRTDKAIARAIEQADRQRWRALYLVIRAKLEAVEAGIAVYEQEFLAFIVGDNDMTIGDMLVPRIIAGQSLPLLLERNS